MNEKILQKLSAEGLKDPHRFVKYIDRSKLEFNDDLEITGFDEQFEQLKKDFPEIFDAKLRVGGQADTAVKASVSTQYSASKMQAEQILGRKV